MITKMIQPVLPHPPMSGRWKTSMKTVISSQIQMKNAKKISIVQNTSSSG